MLPVIYNLCYNVIMKYKNVKTPEDLMQFLDEHIEYGVIDKNGNKFFDSNSDEFQNACLNSWKTKNVKQIIQDGVGHCYDQVEIEREWFESNNYSFKTFWISAYQEGIENSGFSHTYLIYKDKNSWKLFEHSDYFNKGIHIFKTLKEAVTWQAKRHISFAEKQIKPKNKYSVCIKQYTKPNYGISMEQYIEFIMRQKDYHI